METRFIFVQRSNRQNNLEVVFSDLQKDERVEVIEHCRAPRSKLLRSVQKLHYLPRLNAVLSLPLKGIWGYSLDEIEWEHGVKYYIIFTNASLYPTNPAYLMRKKSEYNVKYILFLHDTRGTLGCKDAEPYLQSVDFDYIFTFDPGDAEKYGYLYSFMLYSVFPVAAGPIVTDLYYAGSAVKGIQPLHELYYAACEHGIDTLFRLTSVKREEQDKRSRIIYNEPTKYSRILAEMNTANCILEYVRSVQRGATLRYFEAVCYNKKLLTNNKEVLSSPFYDPKYIQVYDTTDDIDWEWVKERIPIDYHYDGRFSPIRFIDRIIKLETAGGCGG